MVQGGGGGLPQGPLFQRVQVGPDQGPQIFFRRVQLVPESLTASQGDRTQARGPLGAVKGTLESRQGAEGP